MLFYSPTSCRYSQGKQPKIFTKLENFNFSSFTEPFKKNSLKPALEIYKVKQRNKLSFCIVAYWKISLKVPFF